MSMGGSKPVGNQREGHSSLLDSAARIASPCWSSIGGANSATGRWPSKRIGVAIIGMPAWVIFMPRSMTATPMRFDGQRPIADLAPPQLDQHGDAIRAALARGSDWPVR